jgi:hypothetical protein
MAIYSICHGVQEYVFYDVGIALDPRKINTRIDIG